MKLLTTVTNRPTFQRTSLLLQIFIRRVRLAGRLSLRRGSEDALATLRVLVVYDVRIFCLLITNVSRGYSDDEDHDSIGIRLVARLVLKAARIN